MCFFRMTESPNVLLKRLGSEHTLLCLYDFEFSKLGNMPLIGCCSLIELLVPNLMY